MEAGLIRDFLDEHGSGFWLHILGAVAIALLGWWIGVVEVKGWHIDFNIVALVINTLGWPSREAWQHHGFTNIWTAHRVLEWVPAVTVGFIIYAVMT